MIILYSSPECRQCDEARLWLSSNKVSYVEKNLFSNSIKNYEVSYLLNRCEDGGKQLIFAGSQKGKELIDSFDKKTSSDIAEHITNDPSLLKRPILLSSSHLLIGYSKTAVESFLDDLNPYVEL